MNIEQIINADMRGNLQNLNTFVLMGKEGASRYIREIVSCLIEEQDYLTENNMSCKRWKKAVDIQMDYIIRFKTLYGLDFTEVR